MDNPQKRFRVFITLGVILAGVTIVIGILGALGVFHKNPYGPETKIDNFREYIKDTPDDTRDAIFTSLYNTIKLNITEETTPPESGAYIRKDSVTSNYNDDTKVHFNTFIVDIPDLQQSYVTQVSWSLDPEADLGGYPILISCPTSQQNIYNFTNCKDMMNENKVTDLYVENPIMEILPIVVSYYPSKGAKLISYRISYKTIDDDSKIKLVINDYTGGNRERAIQTLKEKGISNPEQYEIEYIDDSIEEFIPPPPRD